jgi:hypothetical protein
MSASTLPRPDVNAYTPADAHRTRRIERSERRDEDMTVNVAAVMPHPSRSAI